MRFFHKNDARKLQAMLIQAVIIGSVFATSLLSGILGMAGGMILMAVLVTVLSVASAMMLHGAVQATANGSRAWFLRKHIRWEILPAYLVGSALALGVFTVLVIVPLVLPSRPLVAPMPWCRWSLLHPFRRP